MSLGYYPKDTTKVVFDYLYFPIQGSNHFAALLGATQRYYRLSSYIPTNSYVLCYGNQQEMPTGFTIDGAVEVGNLYLKVNGNTVFTGNTVGPFTSNVALTFGADKPSGGDTLDNTNTKIGRFRIFENNTLIAEFIPALDENNVAGLYNATNDTFLYSVSSPWGAGPDASSIGVDVSKTVVKAEGETITITVDCENAWTLSTSGDSFLTLSSTGDTGSTTITATAPNYTGVAPREEYLTFTDSVTGDEVKIKIKQKKYVAGQPLYLGADEILEIYLGTEPITEAYLGTELVFSTGQFQGLIVDPMNIEFHTLSLTSEVKVKSSEAWTMTLPAWLTASATGGTSGETTIYLSATTQSVYTSGTVAFTTTNFQTDAKAEFHPVEYMDYVWATQMGSSKLLSTGIYPTLQTKGEVLYEQKTYTPGTVIVGMYGDESGWDNRDWRLFYTYGGDRWAFDIANSRLEDTFGGGWVQNKEYDIEFGNNYIINHTDGLSASTDTVQSGQLDNLPVDINVGMVWVKEVKLWEGNTIIYDGKAAKVGDDYGLIDVVTGHFLTGDDFSITGSTITPSANKVLTVSDLNTSTIGEVKEIGWEDALGNFNFFVRLDCQDDGEGGTVQLIDTGAPSTAYTVQYDNYEATITGPFDSTFALIEHYIDPVSPCNQCNETVNISFTNGSASTQFNPTCTSDPACECAMQGGTWDGSECIFGGGEDACGGDPCCEQGISDPNECDCMMNGGQWDGSECHYD